MNKLTEKALGCFEYDLKDHEHIAGEFATYGAFFNYHMAVKKLGEYEDLEEQGLLIELPCKVGDIVYSVNTLNSSIYEHEIKNFMITDTGKYTYAQNAKSGHQFKLSDFGKTVFLTREEAEKALEGGRRGRK